MNPAADRFRVFCLGMALLLSPALLLAFPSLPVIQADEKQEKAAEKAFDELNEKMNQAQEAYYRPMSEAREKGLSSKEMEKIEDNIFKKSLSYEYFWRSLVTNLIDS